MKFSRFAERFDPQSGILQLMQDLGYAVNRDSDVCMLGGGNPAAIPQMQERFRHEMTELMNRAGEFEQLVGNYDAPQGNRRFIAAVASLLNEEMGWPVGEENVAVVNGSQSGFGPLFRLFSGEFKDGPERRILLPMCPEYIGYADQGGGRNIFDTRKPVIQVDESDPLFFKYRVDFQHLEAADDTGAICISRPTNPTGNVITDDEISRLSHLADSAGAPLIIDGAYGLPFPGMVFVDAAPVWNANTILCLSLSKLGLPGARTGIVVADEKLVRLITAGNALFNLAPGRFGPALVTRLVESRELLTLCNHVIRPYYRERAERALERVRTAMAGLPVRVHRPEGAMFLWLWFEGLPVTSETLYQRLKKRGVYVVAGQHFFPGFTGDWWHRFECIRVSCSGNAERVARGIDIIAEEVAQAWRPAARTG